VTQLAEDRGQVSFTMWAASSQRLSYCRMKSSRMK